MRAVALAHVKLAPGRTVWGGRIGTAEAQRQELLDLLGPSNMSPSDDGRVTIGWTFATPAGPAEVRDYWWNGPTEWSIAAKDRRAALWLACYLRALGFKASTKRTPEVRWVPKQLHV